MATTAIGCTVVITTMALTYLVAPTSPPMPREFAVGYVCDGKRPGDYYHATKYYLATGRHEASTKFHREAADGCVIVTMREE
jgi:hypothetical protein